MTERVYATEKVVSALESLQGPDGIYLRNSQINVGDEERYVTLSWVGNTGIHREVTVYTDGSPIKCKAWSPLEEASDNGIYVGVFESSDENDDIYYTEREVVLEDGMLTDIIGEAVMLTKNTP